MHNHNPRYQNIVTVSNFLNTVEFTFQSDSQKEANQTFVLLCNIFNSGYGSPQIRDANGNVIAVLVEREEIPAGTPFIDAFLQGLERLFKHVRGWFGL